MPHLSWPPGAECRGARVLVWQRGRPDLTISCSYHVAMTTLLHEVPVVYLFGNDYYRQKGVSLQQGFGLLPELTIDLGSPRTDAKSVSKCAAALSNARLRAESNGQLRLARTRALALRHLVSSRLTQVLSAHMASTLENVETGAGDQLVSGS